MKLFKRITHAEAHAKTLEEARLLALQHRAAAEYYAALATMYEARVDRLYGHGGVTPINAKAAR